MSDRALATSNKLAWLIAGATVIRLLAARWIPLTEDEAYYRLWAQHLHLGYYDHPPMIAWWIRLGTTLAGDNPLGVRLLPALGAGLATALVASITGLFGGDPATRFRAALWYNATTTIGVGGIIATPDAPATLFWVLTLWTLARVWAGGSPRWWLAAGAFAGLACISKYSALFLGPGILLWLVASQRGRKSLATPWPWLAGVVAGAIFSSNLIWNAQHHWLTFAKQFGRVAPSHLQPAHLLEFLIFQALLLNPMITVLARRGAIRAWQDRQADAALALPLLTALPFSLYLMFHSLHDRVQAHWPVPLFAGFVIVAALSVEASGIPDRVRRGFIAFTLVVSGLALAYGAFPGAIAIGKLDLIQPLRGWPTLANDIETVRAREGAQWIGTANYGAYAQLAATHRIHAPMIQVIERARYADETARPDFTKPGLIVDLARRLALADVQACFAKVSPAGELKRGAPGGPYRLYAAFRVEGPRADLLKDGCPNDLGKGLR